MSARLRGKHLQEGRSGTTPSRWSLGRRESVRPRQPSLASDTGGYSGFVPGAAGGDWTAADILPWKVLVQQCWRVLLVTVLVTCFGAALATRSDPPGRPEPLVGVPTPPRGCDVVSQHCYLLWLLIYLDPHDRHARLRGCRICRWVGSAEARLALVVR